MQGPSQDGMGGDRPEPTELQSEMQAFLTANMDMSLIDFIDEALE